MRIVDDQTLVLGPPGCGKTTTLLGIVERELESGRPPQRIAYVSFTRKAVEEAVTRACDKFGLTPEDFPYFRTMHSMCFRNINKGGAEVFDSAAKKGFANWIGADMGDIGDEEVLGLTAAAATKEDWCFSIYNQSRIRLCDMEELYNRQRIVMADMFELRHIARSYEQYKQDHSFIDYTDMMDIYLTSGDPLDVDVVIIDEAQDLQPLLWEVARKAFSRAKRVYIAGDDDQCIHEWAGADVGRFLALEGDVMHLTQSYRIPRSVHRLAGDIIGAVDSRFDKPFLPRDLEGHIHRHASLDYVDPSQMEGTSLYIARHVYQLQKYEELLRQRGIVYRKRGGSVSVSEKDKQAIIAWERLRQGKEVLGKDVVAVYGYMRQEGCIVRGYKAKVAAKLDQSLHYTKEVLEREWGLETSAPWFEVLDKIGENNANYYLAVLRNGGSKALSSKPQVSVNTIHGVKGGEADHVILMPDMSRAAYEEYTEGNPDGERRVFYVGVTRARQALHLIEPEGFRSFLM